ncbi:MAG: glutamate--tRNA ligase [Candidatus Woesearchaeota archaeon]
MEISEEIRKDIRNYALQNAIKFNGRANAGAAIGKILSTHPELKKSMAELGKAAAEIINEVNSMPLEKQTEELTKTAPELLEKKEKKKKELPELKNAEEGKVVTRLPPEPSKYLHIGHALSFLINYMYAVKYKGKCVLRFEDTNPEKSEKEYYDSIRDDIEWLKIKPSKEVIVSNDIEKFYHYAEQLIKQGQAYVCFCDREKMRKYREEAMICDERSTPPEDNLEHWKKMVKGEYKEGEAVLRLNGQMDSHNMVMRDPVIFRIVSHKHPIQGDKHKAWPMYDFENALEEELCGITHIMRSSEFGEMRVELQNYLKDLLGFNKQEVLQYGRFNIVGAVSKGREIREMIKEGKMKGWDDPRLVTLKALRRRGIQPEALYDLAVEAGLSKNQTNIDFSIVAAINRKLIDPVTNRYFFVADPRKIEIENAPGIKAEAPLHPEHPGRGKRKFSTKSEFYIAGNDKDDMREGKAYRLMHLFNFKDGKFVSEGLDADLKAKLIHWLPCEEAMGAEVVMPDSTVVKGLVEHNASNISVGEVVQLERFGFCRLDKKDEKKLYFWYTHD